MTNKSYYWTIFRVNNGDVSVCFPDLQIIYLYDRQEHGDSLDNMMHCAEQFLYDYINDEKNHPITYPSNEKEFIRY